MIATSGSLHGDCPVATAIFVRKQAEKTGVSLNKMIEKYAEEAERPISTIRNWVWPQDRSMKIHTTDKPMRKHTKPEVKIHLEKIKDAIESNEITDDDAKQVVDLVADKVTDGTCVSGTLAAIFFDF